ncbi:hypothetical protein [Nocardioides nanhaiensis]|uniref:SAF domain-containing protein n=1 Tax=Nocardioides nanhaiensis TaxID=1476871 RepID=A0ABP8WGE2_9ACTN
MPAPRRQILPSLSLVVSMLALVVALGGASYAAVKINGADIKRSSIPGSALKARAVVGPKIGLDAVTGKNVKESSLGQVPSAAQADTAAGVADEGVDSAALAGITRRSNGESIAAGTTGSVIASCEPGEQVIGGGNDGSLSFRVIASRNEGTTGWRVFVFNGGGGAATLTTHVFCLAP